MINQEILEILREFKIFPADGICYLLSVFYGYEPTYIPDEVKKKIHATNIIKKSEKGNSIDWNIPLFEGQETSFKWVETEYVKLFKDANPSKGGHVREATARMKKFFAKNPEIRKEDVIEATKFYIYNTESKYLRLPHYFIEKGVGASKTSDLAEWVEKHIMLKDHFTHRTSLTKKLQ